ncbi:MAG: hypothetical protein EOO75_15990 [Myxococcales bacterium]|nr:MAG: hypothetical protein EOO75_15990 [Myxococcales bacterium]
MRSLPVLVVVLLAAGCCKRDGGTSGTGAGGTAGAAPGAAGAAATAAPAATAADGLPADIPTSRTPAPSQADWDAAPTARVPTAAPNGCEVNMIREWVRVNCGKRAGVAPTEVTPRGGCSRDTYTSLRTSANLVTALSPRTHCEVEFSWGTAHTMFVADWAPGVRPGFAFQALPATPAPTASAAPAVSIRLPAGRVPVIRR